MKKDFIRITYVVETTVKGEDRKRQREFRTLNNAIEFKINSDFDGLAGHSSKLYKLTAKVTTEEIALNTKEKGLT